MKKYLLIPLLLCGLSATAQTRDEVLKTMRRAATFMVENVSNRGGYLWNYAPDFSRMWGELEAKPTMIWIEPPGTPAMGHLFLDAWHATGDAYYLAAAQAAGRALIWGQLACGGWAYAIDFGGEQSLRDWHETIYKGYSWPAYEHQHYTGNATYDDGGTIMAAELLLRLYIEDYDPTWRPALEKAIGFVLESQYPIGGWPQRWPLDPAGDYTTFITLNDGVMANNIAFLIKCYQTLGQERLLEPIERAMGCVLLLQGGNPQAGWAMQHRLDGALSPGHARPFEPAGWSSSATQSMVEQLMDFYRLTGNSKYLARIPDALRWLRSVAIPESEWEVFPPNRRPKGEGRLLCPTFVEVGTNEGLYLHRTPGNIRTGNYYVDYDRTNLITHYSSVRTVDIARLEAEYEALLRMPVAEATKGSPLLSNDGLVAYPRYYSRWTAGEPTAQNVRAIVAALGKKNYWPGGLPSVSNQYVGLGPDRLPDEAISSWSFIRNMTTLIDYVK